MKTVVITGASDGIGAAAARHHAVQGNTLVLVGRSPTKTAAVAREVNAEHYVADFEILDDVRGLAESILRNHDGIDVLVNNAGGIFSGPTRTRDGFERTFQVNHLAPYLLTNLLIERIVAGSGAIINTSSVAARSFGKLDLDDIQTWRGFTPTRAYGNSKLANILFTKGLHDRFSDAGLSAVAFHPGNISTNFASDTSSYLRWVYRTALHRFLLTSEQGGANLAHFIAGVPGVDWQSGEYYNSRRKIGRTSKQASDPRTVREHWDQSAQMLGIMWDS